LNNFKYENLINDLVKQLGIKEEEIRNIKLEKKKTFNFSKLNDPISFVKSFKKILDSLNKMEPNSTFIKTMNEEYETTLLYMNKEKKNKNYIIRRIFKWKIIFIKYSNW
jgi:hypothetical protein